MKNIIIIGNSAAGIAAVEAIRNKDKDSKIIIVSDEDYPAYCRYKLLDYFSGDIKEELLVYRAKEFYAENNIDLILGKKVIKVEAQKNRIILEDNQKFEYESLLITTGASPKFPDVSGIHKQGAFGLGSLKDVKDILNLLPITNTVCVLGDGFIGLKTACILKKKGIETKVIVKSKKILSSVLDEEVSSIIQRHLEAKGIEILTELDVSEILGNGDIKAVRLDSGKVIGCQLLIIDKGISPNVKIVKDAGVEINEGIIVDKSLTTTVNNIFAAGDCVEHSDIALVRLSVNTGWQSAARQGQIAGRNILGENLIYESSVIMNSIDLWDLPIVFAGSLKQEEDIEILSSIDLDNKICRKFFLKDNCLKGMILLGKIENSGLYLKLIRQGLDISSVKNNLLDGSFVDLKWNALGIQDAKG